MYTLQEVDEILEKASYILSVFAKEEIFLDAANRESYSQIYILNKAVSYEKWRVGVVAYNELAEALNTLLEVYDYLYPVPTAVANFYPIGGGGSIRYITGINDSTTSTSSTWSSYKINQEINDSSNRKTKVPITTAGTKTIAWQTDIAPDSSLTYAAKHGNDGVVYQGYYEDGSDEANYNPNIVITRSGSAISQVQFKDTFVGYIIIT